VSVTQGNPRTPGVSVYLHAPILFRGQCAARPFPQKSLTRWPCGSGPLCFREKQQFGNLAGPKAGSTLRLWGWGWGGLRPTEPLGQGLPYPCSNEGLPPQPLLLPCPRGRGLVFPPGTAGALGPICTSVLANAEELAQQLPPPNPPPPL
jgi:hypothetical protein